MLVQRSKRKITSSFSLHKSGTERQEGMGAGRGGVTFAFHPHLSTLTSSASQPLLPRPLRLSPSFPPTLTFSARKTSMAEYFICFSVTFTLTTSFSSKLSITLQFCILTLYVCPVTVEDLDCYTRYIIIRVDIV